MLGQKRVGLLRKNVVNLLTAVLESTADGSLEGLDPALADEIPVDDRNDSNPRDEEG